MQVDTALRLMVRDMLRQDMLRRDMPRRDMPRRDMPRRDTPLVPAILEPDTLAPGTQVPVMQVPDTEEQDTVLTRHRVQAHGQGLKAFHTDTPKKSFTPFKAALSPALPIKFQDCF
jgi:hypothetical protein